jgi:hypothetical protein
MEYQISYIHVNYKSCASRNIIMKLSDFLLKNVTKKYQIHIVLLIEG